MRNKKSPFRLGETPMMVQGALTQVVFRVVYDVVWVLFSNFGRGTTAEYQTRWEIDMKIVSLNLILT